MSVNSLSLAHAKGCCHANPTSSSQPPNSTTPAAMGFQTIGIQLVSKLKNSTRASYRLGTNDADMCGSLFMPNPMWCWNLSESLKNSCPSRCITRMPSYHWVQLGVLQEFYKFTTCITTLQVIPDHVSSTRCMLPEATCKRRISMYVELPGAKS